MDIDLYWQRWRLESEMLEHLARPLIDAGELKVLDDKPMDIDLYWQRWRLESEMLEHL
ncbi:ArgP/LysG family DNA-binding transcriptional regulator, partial [Bacteroides fragilis]|nr:ArgP/LysG family DNA-binding transcriptional regulator [Bacteroides fragilis]